MIRCSLCPLGLVLLAWSQMLLVVVPGVLSVAFNDARGQLRLEKLSSFYQDEWFVSMMHIWHHTIFSSLHVV